METRLTDSRAENLRSLVTTPTLLLIGPLYHFIETALLCIHNQFINAIGSQKVLCLLS